SQYHVINYSTSRQPAVAANGLKVHRRAGEIPANLPRARMYCGEQTSRPCAPLLQLLERSFSVHPPRTTARTTLPRARGRTEQGLTTASNTDLELPRFRGRVVVLVPNSPLLDVHRSYQ